MNLGVRVMLVMVLVGALFLALAIVRTLVLGERLWF